MSTPTTWAAAAELHPRARRFVDFRELYDHAGEFDAVVVSTCEHTHAFATLPALQLGKHVYCEKPLTHSVWEARVIREAAARAKVATQMGTQIHAGDNYRRVVELIQTGAIGPVREVHVWVGRAWGWHASEADAKQAGDIVFVQSRPAEAEPIPPELNWDLWLGPAPERPFNSVYFPGPKWYRWWDFGNGTMSDLGSHWVDLPFWALELKAPLAIEAQGPPPHPEIAPASMQVTYQYGPRGASPARRVDLVSRPQQAGHLARRRHSAVGQRSLVRRRQGNAALRLRQAPAVAGRQVSRASASQAIHSQSLGHHAEWLHACKTGEPTTCNFDYAGWLTEANHLGNVAFRTGVRLEWDAANMRATNCSDAERFLRRDYRPGWKLA